MRLDACHDALNKASNLLQLKFDWAAIYSSVKIGHLGLSKLYFIYREINRLRLNGFLCVCVCVFS
jgi:hypothetical protein